MMERVEITEDVLFNNGYQLMGFDIFYKNGLIVKMSYCKTGKLIFKFNKNIVRYMDEVKVVPDLDETPVMVNGNDKSLLKLKAFKGDALISFFSRELLCTTNNYKRVNTQFAQKIVSNAFLKEVCLNIGLQSLCGGKVSDYGTTYEAKVYDVFESDGFDAAFAYFKETVYKYFQNPFNELN